MPLATFDHVTRRANQRTVVIVSASPSLFSHFDSERGNSLSWLLWHFTFASFTDNPFHLIFCLLLGRKVLIQHHLVSF
jgi:hypothetical protein